MRIALGLASDDPLPEVDEDTLRAYHRYLAAHLTFPCEAKWEPEYGPVQTVKLTGIGDPEDDACADEMCGLLCEARAEGRLTEVPLGADVVRWAAWTAYARVLLNLDEFITRE